MFMSCSSFDSSTVRYNKNRDIIVDFKVIHSLFPLINSLLFFFQSGSPLTEYYFLPEALWYQKSLLSRDSVSRLMSSALSLDWVSSTQLRRIVSDMSNIPTRRSKSKLKSFCTTVKILTQIFQNPFTVTFSSKFATKWWLEIPSHIELTRSLITALFEIY